MRTAGLARPFFCAPKHKAGLLEVRRRGRQTLRHCFASLAMTVHSEFAYFFVSFMITPGNVRLPDATL